MLEIQYSGDSGPSRLQISVIGIADVLRIQISVDCVFCDRRFQKICRKWLCIDHGLITTRNQSKQVLNSLRGFKRFCWRARREPKKAVWAITCGMKEGDERSPFVKDQNTRGDLKTKDLCSSDLPMSALFLKVNLHCGLRQWKWVVRWP